MEDIPISLIIFAILFTLLSLLFFVEWLIVEYISMRWNPEFTMNIDRLKESYPFEREAEHESEKAVDLYMGYLIFREQVQLPLLALTILSGAYYFLKHKPLEEPGR